MLRYDTPTSGTDSIYDIKNIPIFGRTLHLLEEITVMI